LRVEPLTENLEPAWREFLRGRERALFYASLEYRDILARVLDARPHYLLAIDGEHVCGVLPTFAMTQPSHGTVLNSLPYYGSNGGFITDGRPQTANALAAAWLELERELGCAASTVISSPFDTDLSVYEHLAPTFRDDRIGQVTPLPAGSSEEALFALYDETARRNVRKARKSGVAWRVDNSPKAMAFLYRTHEENIRAIGGLSKSRAFFDAVPAAVPQDAWRVYIAERAGEPIAALLVFRFSATVEYYTPAIVEAARPLQALALLVHEAMRQAAGEGYKWWNWGGTWKSQLGVYRFKRKWGAADMPYRYYTRLTDQRLLRSSRDDLLSAFPGFFVLPFDRLGQAQAPFSETVASR
jgi:hypothetical protein